MKVMSSSHHINPINELNLSHKLATFLLHIFFNWPSHTQSRKIKTCVSSPRVRSTVFVGWVFSALMSLAGMLCLPHVLSREGGHLIAATCWGPTPSGSFSLVWSNSSKQHGSFVTQLYVTMSYRLSASARKKGGTQPRCTLSLLMTWTSYM